MSKWNEVRLGELIDINPETLSVSKYNGKIQYIDIASVNRGQLDGYTEYDIVDAPSRARRIIRNNDIIYSTVRPNLRAYYYVKDCPDNAICSTGFAVLRAKENVDSRFMYSLVTENSFVDYLSLVAKGSAYPAADTADFKKAKVAVPDLPTQKRIADILSAYDDLIENNNRRIALLEKAAQELYKEWFVRFRFPGYEATRFENGLPEGWKRVRFRDVAEIGRGSSPRPISDQRYFENGNIPWIKIADATSSKIYIHSTKEYVNDYGASFSRKLPVGSLILAASGTLGFPMFLAVEGCIHDGWLYFSDFEKKLSKYIYYVLMDLREVFNNVSYGAAIQNINTEIVRKSNIIIPNDDILLKFNCYTEEMHNEIISLQKKNQNLAEQRDLLLPRLMSGKLEV